MVDTMLAMFAGGGTPKPSTESGALVASEEGIDCIMPSVARRMGRAVGSSSVAAERGDDGDAVGIGRSGPPVSARDLSSPPGDALIGGTRDGERRFLRLRPPFEGAICTAPAAPAASEVGGCTTRCSEVIG